MVSAARALNELAKAKKSQRYSPGGATVELPEGTEHNRKQTASKIVHIGKLSFRHCQVERSVAPGIESLPTRYAALAARHGEAMLRWGQSRLSPASNRCYHKIGRA